MVIQMKTAILLIKSTDIESIDDTFTLDGGAGNFTIPCVDVQNTLYLAGRGDVPDTFLSPAYVHCIYIEDSSVDFDSTLHEKGYRRIEGEYDATRL